MLIKNISRRDHKALIHKFIFFSINKIICILTTTLCRVNMLVQGINFGKNVSFRGMAILFRSPGTLISIGDNCTFNSNSRFNFRGINHCCILQTAKEGSIEIGKNCGFSGVSIVSSIGVKIGNNVLCGTNVMIGDRNDHEDIYPWFKPTRIEIGNNVWIGMNSVIMKGVTIGNNVIIGSNSLVTKDIPPNVIAVGSPCKPINQM